MWAVVGIVMLLLPLGHAVTGHSLLGRLGRLIRPGVPASPTAHERRHAQRSRPVRVGATVAWLALLAVAASLLLTGCMNDECAGHGGWYTLSHGIFYCNDGTYDYG